MAASGKELQLIELKDMIRELNTMIRNLQGTIDTLNISLKEKEETIRELQAQNDWFRKQMFGAKSEKRILQPDGQMTLFDEDEEEKIPEIIQPEYIEISYKKEKRPRPSLEEQFKNIPAEKVYVDTLTEEEKTCPACGTQMVPIGHELIRTEIEYTPAKLKKIEYMATTYECPGCKETEDPQFIKDEGKKALIPHSYVSPSLAAWIMYQKYVNALPLYRQEKDFLQFDVNIPRTSMANWMIYCSGHYLKPLYDYLHRELMKRHFIMMDETPVQVLKEPERRAQTKSYAWLCRSGEDGLPAIILFKYTPTRAGDNAADFLKDAPDGFYLMADGYSGYNKVGNARRCCCYAHIRRYLIEAVPKGHEKDYADPAMQGLLYCNKLFEYERRYAEKGLSHNQRHDRRQKDEKPVVEAFLEWAKKQAPVKGSRFAKAITHILNREKDMMTYLEDGRCSLSNNLSENAIRPLTVGRKNWLFSETQDGAEASMTIYSIVEMARTHHLRIYEYLTCLLEQRLDEKMTDEEFEKIVPWNGEIQKKFGLKNKEKKK